jgi:hypothetical protein
VYGDAALHKGSDGDQGLAQAHCEWGTRGIEVLGQHAAVLVIVDVLSFSPPVSE